MYNGVELVLYVTSLVYPTERSFVDENTKSGIMTPYTRQALYYIIYDTTLHHR